jgi:predicted phage tail component-like protein
MKGLRGSFLGLTYNNIHSSLLGITRIIPGDSHEERLVPTFKEQSAWTGNSDGSYYFGATHQKREFVVNIAFEEMTEKQKRQINALWNDREIHELIFDEYPYKVYSAKITGNSTLKQIAHDKMIDGKMERVYSGEGSFVFTCYFPYARSRYEYVEDYIANNIHEWISSQDEVNKKVLEHDAKLE